MGDVTDKLLEDGIDAFVTPFDKLIAGVESAKEAVVTGRPPTDRLRRSPTSSSRAIAKRVETAVSEERGRARLAQGRDAVGRPRARRSATGWAGSRSPSRCSSTRPT